MKCENCQGDHEGTYGSGRFCSSECAKGFSTKAKRSEINEKLSKLFKGRRTNPNSTWKHSPEIQAKITASLQEFHKNRPIEEWSTGRIKKYLIQKHKKCEKCGFDKLNEQGEGPFQVHHKDGNHNNWDFDNLQVLCLNCHWATDNWCHRGRKHSLEAKKKIVEANERRRQRGWNRKS